LEERRIIVLGSTGSIGCNVLQVIEHLHQVTPWRFSVAGLAAGRNAKRLSEQARRFRVEAVAVAEERVDPALRGHPRVFAGVGSALALVDAVARPGDLVVGAMVGAAGIPATLKAIERGCDVALANKETLVAAGSLIMPAVRQRGVRLLPIDSEHSAIFQCLLAGRTIDEVRRLVITASGGPFRTWAAPRLARATVEEALAHPTWSMGPKITIDSATLMNKALEVIEAHWLFGLSPERIDTIIHPQSIVHSFVEFIDGSVVAQLGPPDMRTPIQYALTWPHRADGCARAMDWRALRQLDFEPVDHDRFGALGLAYRVIRTGGTSGAVLNAANEALVGAFLEGRVGLAAIWQEAEEALEAIGAGPVRDIDDVLAADAEARRFVEERLGSAALAGRPHDIQATPGASG
jgi:1-deoxy-D-xylulose-5-phosphate reductoisomerase